MTDSAAIPGLATVLGPAAVLSAAARSVAAGGDDPLAEVLISTPELARVLAKTTTLIDEVPALAAIHQQLADYGAVRARYFDTFLAEAAEAGIRQCVVLAAGLDTRAFRLDWPSGMTVFEVDRPTVLVFKAATLAAHGVRLLTDRHLVGVHGRESWPKALWRAGFTHNEPTAWLAEGLLPVPDADQDALISDIDGLSAAGSRFAFDDALGRCAGRSDAADWLTSRGWWTDVVKVSDLPELSARGPYGEQWLSAEATLTTAEKVA